jgi:hypothetical protein
MNKGMIRKLIVAIIVATAVVLVLVETAGDRETIPQVQKQSGVAVVAIQGLYEGVEVPVNGEVTVLEMLKQLDTQDAAVRLGTKKYEGLGVLVDALNGMKNGMDNKYWQYTVNGVMPQIGADTYKPGAGDRIEWRFTTSAF